jgi:hypothetical protein
MFLSSAIGGYPSSSYPDLAGCNPKLTLILPAA